MDKTKFEKKKSKPTTILGTFICKSETILDKHSGVDCFTFFAKMFQKVRKGPSSELLFVIYEKYSHLGVKINNLLIFCTKLFFGNLDNFFLLTSCEWMHIKY